MDRFAYHHMYLLLLTLTITTLDLVACTMLCPSQCACTRGTVNKNILEVTCEGVTELPLTLPPASTYRLILPKNNIKTLESRPYLSQTDYLDLSYNQIDNVTSSAIGQLLHSVRYLYLQGNDIECLPLEENDFSEHYHANLNEIKLQENPWDCQCIRQVLETWRKQTDHKIIFKDRDKLLCRDDSHSTLHPFQQDLSSPTTSSGWSCLFPKHGLLKKLSQRNGFYAFVATLTALLVILVALGLVYWYKFSSDRKRRDSSVSFLSVKQDTTDHDESTDMQLIV